MAFQSARKWVKSGAIFYPVVAFLTMGVAVALMVPGHLIRRSMTVCGRSIDATRVIQLESAMSSFKVEYGSLPGRKSHVSTDSAEGIALLGVLLGTEPESPEMMNKRRIKFLKTKGTLSRKNGLLYNASRDLPEGLFDSWGNPLIIELELEGEDGVRFKHGSKTVVLPERCVAVYSAGKDGVLGTPDDVTCW